MQPRRVLITGGGGDIAKAISLDLQKRYDSIHIDSPSKKELNVSSDLSIREYIQDKQYDVLINNAGFISPSSFLNLDLPLFLEHINVNLIGVYNCTKCVLENNPSCHIINIGSSAGSKFRKEWTAYCVAKAGVLAFTACLADEGYKIWCVSPGRTKTKMRSTLFPNEDPLTLLSPKDISREVLNVLDNKYLIGSNILVRLNENTKN